MKGMATIGEFWNQTAWQTLTLLFISHVTAGTLPNLFMPQFSHLLNGDNNSTLFAALLQDKKC